MLSKINMIDALNLVDDEIIEKAISSSNSKEKKAMKQNTKSNNKIIRILAGLAACVCIVFTAVMTFTNLSGNKANELVQIANPITEVNSVDEMKQYLGFDVPVIKDKKVEAYIVIGDDNYATHARIVYADSSNFEMEKGNGVDVSGISGGTLDENKTINSVKVEFYHMDDTVYANWSDGTYSYSYSASSSEAVENAVTSLTK